jgi:septal ring factor EnvC (AmiA/AmiB activator)
MQGRLAIGVFLLWTLVPARVMPTNEEGDILFQKKDLDEIQKEVEQCRHKLDSLKQVELKVQNNVSEYDQKIASNKKVLTRLNRQLKNLKQEIARGEEELATGRELLDRARRRYLGNIRKFYLATHRSGEVFSEQVNDELQLNRQVVYLTALAGFESGNIAQAMTILSQSSDRLTQLTGEKKKVTGLKKKKETATSLEKTRKKKKQRELEQLRRKKSAEADRILTLQQAAQEIERIIARIERQRQESPAAVSGLPSGPSVFATLQGQLLSPFKGRIVVGFGHSQDEITKLKSFSPGITIKGKLGRKVVAVADGTVAYVGNLRGYGKFVIINHGDRYYSTYGGLGKTSVNTNEYLLAGTTLGQAGEEGLVKFELRHGREPLDPVKWIRIDSF